MKPEMYKICVMRSGLKAVKIIGMVSQQISTQGTAFFIHFAKPK